jgi:hypothetical protein
MHLIIIPFRLFTLNYNLSVRTKNEEYKAMNKAIMLLLISALPGIALANYNNIQNHTNFQSAQHLLLADDDSSNSGSGMDNNSGSDSGSSMDNNSGSDSGSSMDNNNDSGSDNSGSSDSNSNSSGSGY